MTVVLGELQAWPLEAVFTGDDTRQLFYTPPINGQ